MFGARSGKDANETNTQENSAHQSPLAPRAEAAPRTPSTPSPMIAVPARRATAIEMPGARRSGVGDRTADRYGDPDARKLTVGRGLSLSGEITACDILVVEGKVEAKLSDGKMLEITESGQFRGSVEIENADIAGRYDGQLTVHGRLTIRGTGRVSGMIKYGELEVNAGGQLIGEMQVVGGNGVAQAGSSSPQTSGTSFKSAAKFTSLMDDEDEGEVDSGRKVVNT